MIIAPDLYGRDQNQGRLLADDLRRPFMTRIFSDIFTKWFDEMLNRGSDLRESAINANKWPWTIFLAEEARRSDQGTLSELDPAADQIAAEESQTNNIRDQGAPSPWRSLFEINARLRMTEGNGIAGEKPFWGVLYRGRLLDDIQRESIYTLMSHLTMQYYKRLVLRKTDWWRRYWVTEEFQGDVYKDLNETRGACENSIYTLRFAGKTPRAYYAALDNRKRLTADAVAEEKQTELLALIEAEERERNSRGKRKGQGKASR